MSLFKLLLFGYLAFILLSVDIVRAVDVIEVGVENAFLLIDEYCNECISSRHVSDIDKEDIEGDVNTFVDIPGDNMTGTLNMTQNNITDVGHLFVENLHSGSNVSVWNDFDMRWNNITRTNLTDTVIYNSNLSDISGFPKPNFDSGWVDFNPGDQKLIKHNLGGNNSYYYPVVDAYSSTYGYNHINYGSRQLSYGVAGYRWQNLNSTHIYIWRLPQDVSAEQIRVRIWVYEGSSSTGTVTTVGTNQDDTDVYPRNASFKNMTIVENSWLRGNLTVNGTALFEPFDSEWFVHFNIKNGTNHQGVLIEDVSGSDIHHALDIEQDVNGNTGIGGLHVITKTNLSSSVDNGHTDGILVEANLDQFSSGVYHALDLRIIYNSSDIDMDAIHIDEEFSHILHVGSRDSIDLAWYDNTIKVQSAEGNFTNSTEDMILFEADNSYVYIGDTTNFTTISVALNRSANIDIGLEFYYCNESGWFSLTGVSDTTNGFTESGTITFINPETRGTCHHRYGSPFGPAFSDITNLTYIALKRTFGFLAIKPIEEVIGIGDSSLYFILQKDMIRLQAVSSPPDTCDAGMEGAIYSDDDLNLPCFCDGTSWKQMDDFSTVCS